jgi:hypothetical protein
VSEGLKNGLQAQVKPLKSMVKGRERPSIEVDLHFVSQSGTQNKTFSSPC